MLECVEVRVVIFYKEPTIKAPLIRDTVLNAFLLRKVLQSPQINKLIYVIIASE